MKKPQKTLWTPKPLLLPKSKGEKRNDLFLLDLIKGVLCAQVKNSSPLLPDSYDLSKPISVQEAIFALGYVDHDFYVFREEESNEISVIYKRNAGGYGIINASP